MNTGLSVLQFVCVAIWTFNGVAACISESNMSRGKYVGACFIIAALFVLQACRTLGIFGA